MTNEMNIKFYENAKKEAKIHLDKNEVNDYINSLLVMNHFKKLIIKNDSLESDLGAFANSTDDLNL